QAMQELEDIIQHERLVSYYQNFLMWLRLRLSLVCGSLEKANEVARDARRSLETEQADLAEVDYFLAAELARLSLVLRQPEQAIQTLTPYLERAQQVQRQDVLIYLLAWYSVALYQTGKSKQALAVVARLLALTEPEGYIRVYLDVGELMRQVLKAVLDGPQDDEESASPILRSYVSTLLVAFEQEEQKRTLRTDVSPVSPQEQETLSQTPPRLPGLASREPALIQALTSQEQRVLRLLAAGRSNGEIASDLVVSINTVKAHVKKIYSKLHVGNRVAASEVARALHLL
ncbi:MAG TPA: LuxR C-terminal-related transcriptional regulator, partial [Ktedonosporobacter sp.]|nr:LuxR C-terminal-related transcriptional regulator [Ktedonosporobacter sp.]